MFETIALVFLVIAACISLFLTGKILSKTGQNTASANKSDTRYLDSLSGAFLVFNGAGKLVNINQSFKRAFPDFKAVDSVTDIKDLARYLDSITLQKSPENAFAALLSSVNPLRNAKIAVSKDGSATTYILSKDPLVEDGKTTGFIVSLHSTGGSFADAGAGSQPAAAKSEAATAAGDGTKSTFLANMSREIRTPLNAIIGMTEIVKTGGNMQNVSESMDKINDSAKNVLRIVNSALDMSTLESGKFTLYEEAFAFSNMIQSIRDQTLARAKRKNQQLAIAIDKNIPQMIVADQMRLLQVLDNLLSNAVKFTHDGGHIELTVESLGRKGQAVRLRFSVKDDGIGISENIKSKLFEAFEYTDSSFSRQFGGTGLGLAISQRIVKLMGGTIRAESGTGRGSKFIFEIDCRVPAGQSVPEASPAQSRQVQGTPTYNFYGYTILLVEDVEINREIVQALLEDTGVRLEYASNGQIAISMYTANPRKYNMIYMDIQMPILDGYSASQKIRSLDAEIPIIAMTANASADDIQKCKKCGMNDYIAKPIEVEELLKKTEIYIKQKNPRI